VSVASLPLTWQGWIAAFQTPLHGRLAWRLPRLMLGIVMAKGRRTVASWLRAADLGNDWKSYYYFVASVGRAAEFMAAWLMRLLVRVLQPQGPLLFGIDDTPTKRFGPKVQGAGVHHNPTPGPAGNAYVYGHVWVSVSWIVHHPLWGVIGLPVRALLYVREAGVARLPKRLKWRFRTKLELARQLVVWLAKLLHWLGQPLWFVADGAYAKKPFLQVARQQAGVVLISRLRRDAALYTVPEPVAKGRRGPGRPRIYGRQRISLAKRAGQPRGWQSVSCQQYGKTVVKRIKSFAATYKPAGGRIQVVLVAEPSGWIAYFGTDPTLSPTAILEAAADRFVVDQDYHDLKEVEGVGQQQVRDLWANIGAFHLNMWVHCLTELWAWHQSKDEVCDRSASPWDDPDRRPSHADRRKALQRYCLMEGFSLMQRRCSVTREIRDYVHGIIQRAA
jgi:DDE superfamily endonuclease